MSQRDLFTSVYTLCVFLRVKSLTRPNGVDLDVAEMVLGEYVEKKVASIGFAFKRKEEKKSCICQSWWCIYQFPDDIDDEEDLRELSKVSFQRTVAERSFAGGPMDQHTAVVGDLLEWAF